MARRFLSAVKLLTGSTPPAGTAGDTFFDTDTKTIQVHDGDAWVNSAVRATDGAIGGRVFTGDTAPSAPVAGDLWVDSTGFNSKGNILRWRETAVGGETSLSGFDDLSVALSYTPGYELVHINGVLQVRGQDYVATTGTTITGLTALAAGDVVDVIAHQNMVYGDYYSQAQTNSLLLLATPIGAVTPYAGSTAPTNWLLCDGSAVNRTTYASLFSIISTTYGVGNGSTTFNLPDLQNRIPVGKGSGTFSALNNTGGAETVTLTEAQMPSHLHSIDPPSANFTSGNESADHSHSGTTNAMNQNASHGHTWSGQNSSLNNNGQGGNYPFKIAQDLQTQWTGTTGNIDQTNTDHLHGFSTGGRSVSHTHTTTVDIAAFNSATAGSGNAHNNLQPYIVLNYIIKAI